ELQFAHDVHRPGAVVRPRYVEDCRSRAFRYRHERNRQLDDDTQVRLSEQPLQLRTRRPSIERMRARRFENSKTSVQQVTTWEHDLVGAPATDVVTVGGNAQAPLDDVSDQARERSGSRRVDPEP